MKKSITILTGLIFTMLIFSISNVQSQEWATSGIIFSTLIPVILGWAQARILALLQNSISIMEKILPI